MLKRNIKIEIFNCFNSIAISLVAILLTNKLTRTLMIKIKEFLDKIIISLKMIVVIVSFKRK